jgi:hypothetical protein
MPIYILRLPRLPIEGPWYPTSRKKRARYGAPQDSWQYEVFDQRVLTQTFLGCSKLPRFRRPDKWLIYSSSPRNFASVPAAPRVGNLIPLKGPQPLSRVHRYGWQ